MMTVQIMKIKQIEKPIIGKRTMVGQAFDEFINNLNLPFHQWENEQRKIKSGKNITYEKDSNY